MLIPALFPLLSLFLYCLNDFFMGYSKVIYGSNQEVLLAGDRVVHTCDVH